ncbi:1282_t:CDS:2 [Ambispora gerdemannii]|uniref:1282_t:CDS:1 n=1 Tax=Ambispora gerdemannii TaxID=144530 RepID=A0A9N9G972_9GLOM|nr:1282_t:CDS:2 [Ambispora gerdemannii]
MDLPGPIRKLVNALGTFHCASNPSFANKKSINATTTTASTHTSASTTVTEAKPELTFAVVKKFKTNELIDFLRKEDLELDEGDLEIIRKQKITGRAFLNMTKKEFM